MYQAFSKHDFIKRIYRPETRDLQKGIRCDKNERLELWNKDFFNDLLSEITPIDLATYPDLTSLYIDLAKFEEINSDQILISSGLDGCIKSIFECFSQKGMKIGLPGPTYGMYYVYSDCFQTDIVNIEYSLKDFKINYDSLINTIDNVNLLFIPNPNAPTEDNLDIKKLEIIIKKCYEKDVLIAIDEVYHGFGIETAKKLIKDYPNLLVMRSFSKEFGMPGLRLGYMMGKSELIKRLSQKRFSYETSIMQSIIARKLLDNYDITSKYNEKIVASRDAFTRNIKELGFRVNSGLSNFVLVDFDSKPKKELINKQFLANKIYIKDSLYANPKIVKNASDLENYGLISIGPFEYMKPVLKILETTHSTIKNMP